MLYFTCNHGITNGPMGYGSLGQTGHGFDWVTWFMGYSTLTNDPQPCTVCVLIAFISSTRAIQFHRQFRGTRTNRWSKMIAWFCHLLSYKIIVSACNAVVTCEIKLFQNYFRGLLQLVNIFQHVQCRWNSFETTAAAEIISFHFQTWLAYMWNKTLK